jgi:hypothetical protein
MNIFFLDNNIEKCAQYHCDKHIVKQILEYSQLLCSAHWMCGSINTHELPPYKLTHKNHPCSVWVRKSMQNYNCLLALTEELLKEYTFRYGKHHKCESVVRWCNIIMPNIPTKTRMTPRPKCMPIEIASWHSDVVKAYRKYYMNHKASFAKWKKRPIPIWFIA